MSSGRIISELLEVAVGPSFSLSSLVFSALRDKAVKRGVKEQYYGLEDKNKEILFWVIQWPESLKGSTMKEEAKVLDTNQSPQSWLIPFNDAADPRPALLSSLCEFCNVPLKPEAERDALMYSLEKTFTDCYEAQGFIGGAWGTDVGDDRMNWYYLGWETLKHHADYSKTDLFWLEINNLSPHMAGGEGHFVKMIQQLN